MNNKLFEENIEALKRKKNALASAEALLRRDAAADYLAMNESVSFDELREYYSSAFHTEDLICDGFARFCAEISPNFEEVVNIHSDPDAEADDSQSKIAYLKNAFSDKAFTLFSAEMKRPTAGYSATFRDVCEEVYYGRSRYAILPIYSSTDGILTSFRSLILKYDLKICMTAQIETDNESFTRFALLQKGLPSHTGSYTLPIVLYISVSLSKKQNLSALISAISALGAEIKLISTSPGEYYTGEYSFDIVLETNMNSLSALYLFMECTHVRYNIIGDYKKI